MSVVPPPPPPPPPAPPDAWGPVGAVPVRCQLCGTGRAGVDARCGSCGLHPGLGPAEANPLGPPQVWTLVGVFVAIYAFVFAVVAATS